ncbi:Gfo/Idh/MocA family protein [Azospirillum soli]|uniref:Gfo/Idh/MocA family protein n=1 Tax=Azospirillum soli TaxID=1304799 RepID=UPI001AE3916C|nr:Gfo/Idh/MocA family oxidoreductase [Azospirillum soli]MBP2316825.1 putative dehydrogenase [Azospirillum soli]
MGRERPVAVLGLGSIGLRHARNLLGLGQSVVGFDPDPERRGALQALGGRAMDDRTAVLDEARAVVVASPNAFHLADLADAVARRLPVLVEKPLAHNADACARLLKDADAQGVIVAAALNLRFHPAVRAARACLLEGKLGHPLWARLICASYLPAWRPHQDYRAGYTAAAETGGVLFDIIHEFDLAIHLLGPGRTLAAAARRSGLLEIASEDCADVILAHDSGVRSALHLDYVTRPRRRVTEIAGTEGLLEINLNTRQFRRWNIAGDLVDDIGFPGIPDEDYISEMTEFLDCVAGRAYPTCEGLEALMVLKQVIAARALAALPSTSPPPSPEI